MHLDTSYTAHCGLHNLGIPDISGLVGTPKMTNTEPVCHSNDGAYIAWILHTVQGDMQTF